MDRRLLLSAAVMLAFAGCQRGAPTSDRTASGNQFPSAPTTTSSRYLTPPADSARPLTDPPQLLSADELRAGWIALFDGRTLFGWTANSVADWAVREGEIVCVSGKPGLLLTTTTFLDFELRCEAWLEPGGNSGLFLRTVPHPQNPAEDCLEFNLCDSHDSFPTGSLVARAKADSMVPLEGDWHAIALVIDGERITAKLDGRTVLDATSPSFATTGGGHIGLQQNGGEVRFRNLHLRPLGVEPLFDGRSLSGWRKTPGSEARMTVEDGAARLRGAGYLESRGTFADFLLQFEARLNAPDVNSGLFFRAVPSTPEAPSNGYELQLQNTIADGDRTRPADYGEGFGTGAIFRRQRARYVNASDEEWFFVTLAADGNHFASWVNGLQVTDFTDDRKPDPNPRVGRSEAAGHLSFQGHDESTDASFRNVGIVPLN